MNPIPSEISSLRHSLLFLSVCCATFRTSEGEVNNPFIESIGSSYQSLSGEIHLAINTQLA